MTGVALAHLAEVHFRLAIDHRPPTTDHPQVVSRRSSQPATTSNGNIELKKGKFIGNDTIRGVVTLPAGQHKVTVKQSWDAAPISISAITTYDAHLWIEDLTKDGFTANVNPTASSEAKIYWSAIW